MKKLFISFSFFILSIPAFAQQKTRQQKIDSIAKNVVQYWNQKNSDKIYEMAGAAFRKELPENTFRQIADNNLFPLGAIIESSFISHSNGLSKYKVVTPAGVLQMLIAIDDSDRLETFLFQPFKEEVAKRSTPLKNDNLLSTLMDRQVDTLMQRFFADSVTAGGSLGILKDGKTYFYNYGETAKGTKKLPTKTSLYEIGSISKTFTATLLALAVSEGKMKLSDPVNKFLPASVPLLARNGKTVTVEMLSNHSSGFSRLPAGMINYNALNPYSTYGDKAILEDLAKLQLESDPGTKYSYSNFAMGTLGVLLERVYKKNYDQLVTEKIAGPLGMKMTGQFTDRKFPGSLVQGHNEGGKATPHWEFQSLAAAGGLLSNTEDLLKYASANIATTNKMLGKAIQLTHRATFISDSSHLIPGEVESIGLGWHTAVIDGKKVQTHSGGTGGFRTFLAIIPESKLAVVFLTNQDSEVQGPAIVLLEKLMN